MGHASRVTTGNSVHHQPGNSFRLSPNPIPILVSSSVLLETTLLLLPEKRKHFNVFFSLGELLEFPPYPILSEISQ